jgi:hypothetical protein
MAEVKDQAGQSLCSRKAAHGTNRIFSEAVLLHARTFGLSQPAPGEGMSELG